MSVLSAGVEGSAGSGDGASGHSGGFTRPISLTLANEQGQAPALPLIALKALLGSGTPTAAIAALSLGGAGPRRKSGRPDSSGNGGQGAPGSPVKHDDRSGLDG